MRMVKHRKSLHREVMESRSVEVFKMQLDTVLDKLLKTDPVLSRGRSLPDEMIL